MRKLFFIVIIILISFTVLYAQVPELINYQGFLKDNSGQPLEGQVNLHFRIFNTQTGGDPLWDEAQSNVEVRNGIFNVLLGDINSFDQTVFHGSGERFLEIEVNTTILPGRFKITSVAYAIRAQGAEFADNVADNAIIPAKLADGAVQTAKFAAGFSFAGVCRGD